MPFVPSLISVCRPLRRAGFVLALSLLAACQLALPQGGGTGTTEGGSAATAAPEDAALVEPGGGGETTAATAPAEPGGAPAAPVEPQMTEAEIAPEAGKDAGPPDAPAADAAVPAETEVPAELKSPAQIACEKRGGTFATVAGSTVHACVRTTRDAGKSCRKEGDCEGACLARSRTCSPITPLFGCQQVLQQDGREVTECVQ